MVLDRRGNEHVLRIEIPGNETEIIRCDPLPEGRSNVAEELVHHLDTGDPLHLSLTADFNLEVMAILEAGMRSSDTGKFETADQGGWHIG